MSNDNPYSESLFKTLKYLPTFPERFGSLTDARAFMDRITTTYNRVRPSPWVVELLRDVV